MLHQSHSILPWLINNTKRYWNSSTWAKVHQRPGVGTPADSKGLRLGAHSQHNHFTFGYRQSQCKQGSMKPIEPHHLLFADDEKLNTTPSTLWLHQLLSNYTGLRTGLSPSDLQLTVLFESVQTCTRKGNWRGDWPHLIIVAMVF